MKTILSALVVTLLLAAIGHAECVYFRTTSRLSACAAADAKAVRAGDLYQAPTEIPELVERNDKVLVQISCECEYSLTGSDLRCDMDQTIERSSVIDAESVNSTCRQGRSLCGDLCPPRLP